MDKRNLLLLPACAPALLAGCQAKPQETKPLNIVYIMTDDHSYQTLSAYDNRYIHTPHLDRLYQEGLRFDNSFVANSISGPSRACILTGKHSHMNGFTDNRATFDGSQQTFAKLLTEAGYQTAVIGKWHLVSDPQGFTHWEILPGQGDYYNPYFYDAQGRHREQGYVTDLVTDKSIEWLEQRDKTKPFCLLSYHKAVHRSWLSPTEYLNEFEDQTFPIPETYWDSYEGREAARQNQMSIIQDMDLAYDLKVTDPAVPTRFGIHTGGYQHMDSVQRAAWDAVYEPISKAFMDANLSGKELGEWKFQRYMRDYLKCVRSLDENVGRLLDYLEKEGLLENTLVMYASDQGFYMGEHGWFDKRFMYEESLRTPLLVRLPNAWKKAPRGQVVTDMVQNIDYAPTFLELAGVEVPQDIQGRSFVPLLHGQTPKDWRQSIYYHYYEFPDEHYVHPHYGIRTQRYKLMRFYEEMDQWELYDLQEDPMEMHNLYGDPAYQEVAQDLHQQLEALRVQYQDTAQVQ